MAQIVRQGFANAKANERKFGSKESGARYSIKDNVVDNNGISYNNVVVLDTNIFNGIKTRNWATILYKFVYKELAGKRVTVYDEHGNESTIEFAKMNERVKKDGAKNEHKVIDKLARKKGLSENLAVAHAEEILLVSETIPQTDAKGNHKWLDQNGWSHKKAIIMDMKGNIYEATLNIAHSRDGRNILYDINKITVIGHGAVPSNSKSRGSHINTHNGITTISQPNLKSNPSQRNNAESDTENDPNARKSKDDTIYDGMYEDGDLYFGGLRTRWNSRHF